MKALFFVNYNYWKIVDKYRAIYINDFPCIYGLFLDYNSLIFIGLFIKSFPKGNAVKFPLDLLERFFNGLASCI